MKTAEEMKKRSKEMIQTIVANIENGYLNILGKKYAVGEIHNHTIDLTGVRGTKYTLLTCPKAKCIEDETMPVFCLVRRKSSLSTTATTSFGWVDGAAIELTLDLSSGRGKVLQSA